MVGPVPGYWAQENLGNGFFGLVAPLIELGRGIASLGGSILLPEKTTFGSYGQIEILEYGVGEESNPAIQVLETAEPDRTGVRRNPYTSRAIERQNNLRINNPLDQHTNRVYPLDPDFEKGYVPEELLLNGTLAVVTIGSGGILAVEAGFGVVGIHVGSEVLEYTLTTIRAIQVGISLLGDPTRVKETYDPGEVPTPIEEPAYPERLPEKPVPTTPIDPEP